ncbi:alpha/beta hydrolase [Amycolatopsis rhabdoformis]|uniref:Alpha/beta hydrolase n=1 Tax=Amycolatopsis rhabdoformis TaxID=1448059 RepID=A0ABZ1II28_9PSEU|nr:alpha/beta hydrolase [Amycolatopsis rhabdoformis]WSE34070.1 alpha/beta hydrolase [Amycolatopsis rhabdoformis]
MAYLETPDVVLFFEDHWPAGDRPGPPLVLLHGWACDSADWTDLAGRFTARHRVVTVDLRGNGRSSTSADGYSPAAMARDVAGILDVLDTGPAVVVGHSAGAEVAAALAVAHPDHVRGVVAVDPAYGFALADGERLREVSRQLAGPDPIRIALDYFSRFDANPATPRALAELHLASARRARPEVVRAMFDEFAFGAGSFHFRPDTDAYLARRRAPLLAFYRNEIRAAAGREFARGEADRVLTYPGAGHWLHQEQPDRFTADVEQWLGDPTTTGADS